jgi:hypothetical protein
MKALRKTRRRIAYWTMALISLVVVWLVLPGDIHPLEQALAMVVVPALVGLIVAFITGETYSDHSERKHNNGDSDG